MKKYQIFLYFCLIFIAGIGFRSFFEFDIFWLFLLALIGIIASSLFWKNKIYRVIFLGAVFLFLGALRFKISEPKINQNNIAFYNNQQIEFVGKIVDEPEMREKSVKLTIDDLKIYKKNNALFPVSGKILVNYYKFNDLKFGDLIKVKCKLQKPGIIKSNVWRDFDYGKYLSVKNIYSVCYRSEISKFVEDDKFIFYQSFTNKLFFNFENELILLRKKFKKIIDLNLPLPESGLLNAVLLGYRQEIPNDLRANFSKAGVSHIVAISGLHISIIALIVFYIFIWFGVSRRKAFLPSILFLFLYVAMISFRASAVRAFIMSALALYALKIGRLKFSFNLLVLAGIILLLFNPKLLIFDVGFQLSFLAIAGILLFFEKIQKWLEIFISNFKIRSIVAITLSAQILTLPLVFYYFGVISFISPISNLLILPILPFVLVGGILLIIFGLIYGQLAFVFGWFLIWFLKYIIFVVEILVKIPGGWFKI